MPGLDGIEVARKILEQRPIPVVIVTAFSQREVVERAIEAGVFGYLVKPFRETDLLPAIETARARHAELQAVRAESSDLRDALAARKTIERAKGLLMERDGLTEADAFTPHAPRLPADRPPPPRDRRSHGRDAEWLAANNWCQVPIIHVYIRSSGGCGSGHGAGSRRQITIAYGTV